MAAACTTMCSGHVAVPCAACSARLLLEQQARVRGCVLLPLPAGAEIAVKWKSAALRAARGRQYSGKPRTLLSGSKEDAKYILANIKNSLSHDNKGKKC